MKIYNNIPGNKNEKWIRDVVRRAVCKAIEAKHLYTCNKVVLCDLKIEKIFTNKHYNYSIEIDGVKNYCLQLSYFGFSGFIKSAIEDSMYCHYRLYSINTESFAETELSSGEYTYTWKYYLEELFDESTLQHLAIYILVEEGIIKDLRHTKGTIETDKDNLIVKIENKEYLIILNYHGEYPLHATLSSQEDYDQFGYSLFLQGDKNSNNLINGKKYIGSGQCNIEGHNQIPNARKEKRIRLGVNFR